MKIGAAWVAKDKSGQTKLDTNGNSYLSCYIEIIGVKFRFCLFKNTPKDGQELHPNAPTFNIVAFSDKKDDNNQGS